MTVTGPPRAICSRKRGTTLPDESSTLPNRTVTNRQLELVDRATEDAKAGPFPGPDALETELWADGGSSWRS